MSIFCYYCNCNYNYTLPLQKMPLLNTRLIEVLSRATPRNGKHLWAKHHGVCACEGGVWHGFWSSHSSPISLLHDVMSWMLFHEMTMSPITPQNMGDFLASKGGVLPDWVAPACQGIVDSVLRIQYKMQEFRPGETKAIMFTASMIALKMLTEEPGLMFRPSDYWSLMKGTIGIAKKGQCMSASWYGPAELKVLAALDFRAPCTGVLLRSESTESAHPDPPKRRKRGVSCFI